MNTPEYYDFEYMIILDCTTGFTQLSCGDAIEMDDNVYDKPDVVKPVVQSRMIMYSKS